MFKIGKIPQFLKNLFPLKGLTRKFSVGGVNLATEVCGWPKADYGPLDVTRSEYLNGLKIVGVKTDGAQISCVTVMFSVGSRYEQCEELGVTHFLRTGSYLSGCCGSNFMRTRFLQQQGAYIHVTSDRQTVTYTLRCAPSVFSKVRCHFLDAGPRNFFYDFELDEVKKMIYGELQRLTPKQCVMDLIQKAAWTGGLNNSIYCAEGRIDGINMDLIDGFVERNFQTSTCTIASYGVSFEELLNVAAVVDSGRTEKPKTIVSPRPSCFRCEGYESLDLGPDVDTYVAIAVPSAGTCDFIDMVSFSILAHACGCGHVTSSSGYPLTHTPAPPIGCLAEGDPYTEYTAFNISYTDTGLFGILVKSPAKSIGNAAAKAARFLRSMDTISVNQVAIGKRRLQVQVFRNEEDVVRLTENFARQMANGVKIDNAVHFGGVINDVNPACVLKAAATVAYSACNMAVAVVGDLAKAPHDGDLRALIN